MLTGLWPLVSIASFESVTGPKTDVWLVRTVGMLVVVMGAVLLTARARHHIGREIVLLGLGSALGFALIDLTYASHGTVSRVYLADAIIELVLAAAWSAAWIREVRPRRPRLELHPRPRGSSRWP